MMAPPRVDFTPSPQLYPFASRWFESAVGPVHYLDEGEGRPIVLMHGNPTWSFLYRKMIPPLRAAGFRCIAMDLPGHGLSPHPDGYGFTAAEHAQVLQSLIRKLELQDLVLLGQDWGGPIGLWAAAQEADRVGGVALGYTFGWRITDWFTWSVAKMLTSTWGQAKIAGPGFTAQVLGSLLKVKLSDEELRHYTALHPTPEHKRPFQQLPRDLLGAGEWLSQLEQSVRERLGGKRALLFWGGHSEWLLGRATHRFQTMFPDHVRVPLGRAGHFFQEDAPEAITAAIVERFGRNH